MDTFDAAWDVLAEQSKCDSRGGAEYRRCRAEWEARGEMLAALVFIATHANQSPGGGNQISTAPIDHDAPTRVDLRR